MLAGQDIPALGQRIEVIPVQQVLLRQIQIPLFAGQLVNAKQVFRQDVRLIVRRLLWAVGPAVVDVVRDVGESALDHTPQKAAGLRLPGELRRVQQPDFILVQDVAWPCGRGLRRRVGIVVRADCGGVSLYQCMNLGSRRTVARARPEPRQP